MRHAMLPLPFWSRNPSLRHRTSSRPPLQSTGMAKEFTLAVAEAMPAESDLGPPRNK